MSDRNSISIAFRKKMVFFRGAECWLAETLLLHALLAAALKWRRAAPESAKASPSLCAALFGWLCVRLILSL